MNRRTLVRAGLATIPASVLVAPAGAKRRPIGHQPGSRAQLARRRQRGGLAAARVRARVVTRTFFSLVPLTIPATSPNPSPADHYPSTIRVGGFRQGRILKVRATLIGFSHEFPSDADVLLVAPDNIGVMLMSDAGGLIAVNGVTLTFDQDAPGVPPETLVTGVFQPANFGHALDPLPPPAPRGVSGHALSRFTNRDPNGSWRLFVFNETGIGLGSLAGWSLTIRARVRVPLRPRHRPPRTRRPGRRPKH